jgi:predicted nuclease with TOPRIM domain
MKPLLILCVLLLPLSVHAQVDNYEIAEIKRNISSLSQQVRRLEAEVQRLRDEVTRLQRGDVEVPEMPEINEPKSQELTEEQELILECVRVRGNDDQVCFDDPENGIADFKETDAS